MTNKVFNQDQNLDDNQDVIPQIPEENPLDVVVGDGKYYKTPVELVKGIFHKDGHIKRIESENERLRQEIASARRVEELLDKALQRNPQNNGVPNGQNPPSNQPSDPSASDPTKQTTGVSLQDIETLLNQRDANRQAETNISTVKKTLVERFGKNAFKTYQDKAATLGVSTDKLDELAAQNPAVLLELFPAAPAAPEQNNQLPSTQLNTQGKPTLGSVRNSKYYADLKLKDQKLYLSPKVQLQMTRDAMEQGEKFYQ